MRRIAIEEHFNSKHNPNRVNSTSGSSSLTLEDRIKSMDEAGIDLQVLSMSGPGPEALETGRGMSFARQYNDELYEAIKTYPKRLAGFAALAPQAPKEAAKELERAVKQLGLKGALLKSNNLGSYLDEQKYLPILEAAEELGVPIYLHPIKPSGTLAKSFEEYPELGGSMWGFAVDAGLAAMRLICSGIFDRLPTLTIILGHLGEALPYWLWRIDNRWEREHTNEIRHLNKKPTQYIKENFYITTSGCFDIPPFMCAYSALSASRIMFAVDYPPESNLIATKFMDNVPIPESEKHKIYHLNAESLLHLST